MKNKKIKLTIVTLIILLILIPLTTAKIINQNTETNGNTATISKEPRFTQVNGLWKPINEAITITNSDSNLIITGGEDSITFEVGIIYDNNYYKINEAPTNANPNFNTPTIKKTNKLKYNIVANLIGLNPTKIENIKLTTISSTSTPIYSTDKIIVGKLILEYDDMLLEGYNYTITDGVLTIGNIGNNIIGNIMFIDPTATLNETGIIKDSYVKEDNPNDNFGTDTKLKIQGQSTSDQISLITWNITGVLPANATNITVTQKLNLTTTPAGSGFMLIVNATNTTWIETSITYNNFFCTITAVGEINLSTPSGCDSLINVTTINSSVMSGDIITSDVSQAVNVNTETFTIVMYTNTSGLFLEYGSRQFGGQNEPSLFLSWDEETIPPPIPPPEPIPPFELEDTLDLSSCGAISSDMVLNNNDGLIYIHVRDVADSKIAIVDISDPTNMLLLNCIDAQDIVGTVRSIEYLQIDSTSSDGFLSVVNTAGTTSVTIFNVSNNGLELTKTFDVASVGSQPFQFARNLKGTGNNQFIACRTPASGNIETHTIFSTLGSSSLSDFTETGTETCGGISTPVTPFGEAGVSYHLMSTSIGQFLLKSGTISSSNESTVVGLQNADPIAFNPISNIYAVFGDRIVLYELTVNNDSINIKDVFTSTMPYGGGVFIGTDIILTMIADGINATLIQYNISDVNNIVHTFNQSVQNISVGSILNDMIYVFPTLFIKDEDTLKSFTFEPSEFNSSNNVKPRINNLASSLTTVALNKTITITYTVDNPETLQIGENILTTLTCEYTEVLRLDETFDVDFNFTEVCDSINIGSLNGFPFGVGIDLSTCNNDFLLLNTNVANETIVSFDILTPTGESSNRQIQLIDFVGNEIITLNISVKTDGFMTVRISETNTILLQDIPTKSVLSNIPTRIFLQLNPVTTNPLTSGVIFISTNVFASSSATDIDQTFCNNGERCFIGESFIPTNPYSNFFGLFLTDTGSGNMALDNFRVKLLNQYPLYDATLDLGQERTCIYNSIGTKTVRVYASDVLFDHNYLNFRDIEILVSITGIPAQEAFQDITQTNATGLDVIITDLAKIAVGESGLFFLGLVIMFITTIVLVLGLSGLRASFEAMLVGVGGSWVLLTIGFFVLAWFPLLALLLVILLVAGLFAIMWRNTVTGSG